MAEPPRKRRRTAVNPYLDLEAAVDRDDELEEDEAEQDRAFIDDESEEDKNENFAENMYRIRRQLADLLSKEGHLDGGAAVEEEEHAGLLCEWLGLKLRDGNDTGNPVAWDDEVNVDDEEEAAAVPRPLWAGIAYNNPAVSGALNTWRDDDFDRQISEQDSLYEVSCQPGMEETIAFRIFSWALQVDSSGPTKNHILAPASSDASFPRNDAESPVPVQKRVVLARSAIANPFLRGRVYIESAKIGYVQRLARRVRGLNPASVRPVPRELLLRPLLMMRHSFPDRTFVRLLDPPCPSMTCLIIKDYLLMVPKSISSAPQEPSPSVDRFNVDTDAIPDPPPDSRTDDPLLERHGPTPAESDIWIDQYGFRYLPLKKLAPSSLEAYEPSTFEVELLFKFGRLNNRHYKRYMSHIMAYSFSMGDRVIFQAGRYNQLVGTVLDCSNDDSCGIYVPSQGSVVHVGRRQLRRQFRVGDRVSATTDDVMKKLGSRIGWVVSASEGYKAAWSSIENRDPVTGQLRTQVGYRVDLRVYSPESGKEIAAAHYEFQFEDLSSVSLQTTTPSPVSEMTIGAPYTLTIPLGGFRCQSFFGIVTALEGVRVRRGGTEASTELSASVVFSIWDKNTDAPFGYSADWVETTVDFTDYNIQLGDIVTLKDQEGRCGTAQITSLDKRQVSLANFTGALKVSNLESVRQAGPHDEHIGKTVRVSKGPYRGCVGIVKTVNTVGTCTVELNILPIRNITVNITCLCAVDESALYMSLLPILDPPVRAQTPPAPAPSSDTPPAFQPSASDVPPNLLRAPDLDCSWLTQAFARQMPVKLEPVDRKMQRPYHFSHTFYDNTKEVPRLMVQVFDRKRERAFAADELRWLPASDVNQTVVRITGEDNGVLYWTVLFDRGHCQVRQVPSKRGAPLFTFPRLQLAQVNGTRT